MIFIRKNLYLLITLIVFAGFLLAAKSGMATKDFFITLLRGFSTGSITFLVAAGFSLIFGLLDVLNLAHGTLFMIGAYIGWTMYVRPDTIVDLLTPLFLLLSGFALPDIWNGLKSKIFQTKQIHKLIPWLGLILAGLLLAYILPRYPISTWDIADYAQSPVTYSFNADQGTRLIPPAAEFINIHPLVAILGLIAGGSLASFSLGLFSNSQIKTPKISWRSFAPFAALILLGVGLLVVNEPLSAFLSGLNSNWLFLLAIVAAMTSGAGLGSLIESAMIRPLYSRPIYQLMLTLGLSAIGIEIVRSIWGRPEFTIPTPAFFNGSGEGCPATSLTAWWENHCTTILLFGGRVRVYNEIFIPLVGILVLVAVWIILKRSRLGMVIRAGVQDREMVEALGINVRQVFTMVFALGVSLAALGGILAAPAMGLSNAMGESLLLNALIALAIGGLTSYPGAALGSLLVGLIQQFMIKYGAIGIPIPFTEIIFKPTPPIVPASTVLLMVIILLILPNGLLGKKE